jgi:hypothetical protein
MAVSAVLGEDLEPATQRGGVVGAQEAVLGPGHQAVMGAHFGHLFFVAFDAPEGADVISVAPALRALAVIHNG